MSFARHGDVMVIHTLDRLGCTVRDTLNLIHDLAERRRARAGRAPCDRAITRDLCSTHSLLRAAPAYR